MKIKVNPRLRGLVSKHFIQRLPKISMPVQVTLADFNLFWDKTSLALKRNSLIFFSKDLIDLVNKINSRLLYCDLVSKKQGGNETSTSQSYDY